MDDNTRLAVERILHAGQPSTEGRGPAWDPSAPARDALARLRAVRRSDPDAVEQLVVAAGLLLTTASVAWWPLQVRGEIEMSAEEMPVAVLHESDYDPGSGEPGAWSSLVRLRADARALLLAADRLADASPETVSTTQVEVVAYPALQLAVRVALYCTSLGEHGRQVRRAISRNLRKWSR